MRFQTLSVVVGGQKCNAACPYCIAKLTPPSKSDKSWDYYALNKAVLAAQIADVSTVILTGKGEPTLYPDAVSGVLSVIDNKFPFIEMQTNGIAISKNAVPLLGLWKEYGLGMVSISVSHYDSHTNASLLSPAKYYDFWEAVKVLHEACGISVRMNCTMCSGYVDSVEGVERFIEECVKHNVEQITFRAVVNYDGGNSSVHDWVDKHGVGNLPNEIKNYLDCTGATRLLELPHGAIVYDYNGQNVCVNNCLTSTTNPDEIRQLICFPDGSIRYDWKHEGARLL